MLLSQTHRLRALVLLARFLDLGPWAVNLALSVGIFPYVLKLLQSQVRVRVCTYTTSNNNSNTPTRMAHSTTHRTAHSLRHNTTQ